MWNFLLTGQTAGILILESVRQCILKGVNTVSLVASCDSCGQDVGPRLEVDLCLLEEREAYIFRSGLTLQTPDYNNWFLLHSLI